MAGSEDPLQSRAEQLFLALMELPEKERQSRLIQECSGNTDLRELVEALLLADQQAATFFSNIEGSAEEWLIDELEDHVARGKSIGPYRIRHLLKQGGMGTVFVADRDDGEYQRAVAIKMLPADLNDGAFKRQFTQEKEMLGGLQHPHIVHLLDAGTSPSGRPYFVMELVSGTDIISYCRQKQLSSRQCIELMIDVLDAVQHAHQHLVVHSDLKPTNILVDDRGQVKLLDFGIARLTNQRGAALAGYSPLYAAPEQRESGTVTLGTDIHQLGQMLYELLIGRRWHDDRHHPGEASSGDLNAILRCATADDPSERYPTARDFQQDLVRYLEHQCVAARSATAGYRLGKFIRRNRTVVAGVGGVFLALLLGLLVAWKQSLEIAEERDHAMQVTQMLAEVFESADPSVNPGFQPSASELIDLGLKRIRGRPKMEPAVLATLLDRIGRTYQNLGHYEKARTIFQEVLALHQMLETSVSIAALETQIRLGANYRLQSKPAEAEEILSAALRQLDQGRDMHQTQHADALSQLGLTLGLKGDNNRARKYLSEARDLYHEMNGRLHRDYAQSLSNLASVDFKLGNYPAVEVTLLEAKQIREQLVVNPGDLQLDHEYATAANNLGLAYFLQGKLGEGETMFRLAVDLRRNIFSQPHPDQAQSLTNLGLLLDAKGESNKALPHLQEALRIREEIFAPDHLLVAASLNNVATAHLSTERFDLAKQMFAEALRILEAKFGEEHNRTATAHSNLGLALLELGQFRTAKEHLEIATRVRTQLLPKEHLYHSYSLLGLGRVNHALKNDDEALRQLLEAFKIREQKLPAGDGLIGEARLALAQLLIDTDRVEEGEEALRSALVTLRVARGQQHYLTRRAELLAQQTVLNQR